LGNTYNKIRLYEEAERYLDRAISISPDVPDSYWKKAQNRISRTGRTESARQVLEEALKRVNSEEISWNLVYIDIYEGKYQDALDRLSFIREDVWEDQNSYRPKDAIRGFIYELMGQPDKARALYENARIILEKKTNELPDDPRIHAELGNILAHLGVKREAIQEGKKAVDLLPISRDAWRGPHNEINLAVIYTVVGDHEAAINKLEYLLRIPAGAHIGKLKVDPVWNPLRNHPRFQKLLGSGE
jgi:serine/threonine-protein kinase